MPRQKEWDTLHVMYLWELFSVVAHIAVKQTSNSFIASSKISAKMKNYSERYENKHFFENSEKPYI